ncbi:hypothetical protein GGR50DRAFT_302210 [Xylaria sp. CBS 124048]|nr:hypothetical protein GGR50DRAFT_302210 [Xylaria sp. CBS 124048]
MSSSYKLNENGVPDFDALPLRKGDPLFAAWGLYGPNDELGFLNRLTDERVEAAAREEIRSGKRISLNLPLNSRGQGKTLFERQAFHQDLMAWPSGTVNDDIWTFNSQVSTQWDGLRHFGYQEAGLFYNGATQEDIHGVDVVTGEKSVKLGIQAWAEKGIVGRGVLLDYHRWRATPEGQAQTKVKDYQSFAQVSIPLEDLQACLKWQGTELKFGDILFVRTGFTDTLSKTTDEQLEAQISYTAPTCGGVEKSERVLRWIWENFSAVAGDQPAFEVWPPQQPWSLHEVLLAGWGCPIGELFGLEKVSAHCAETGRYTFFVASEVCDVPGGVASPPNVLAIF